MLNLQIITIGKLKKTYYAEAIAEYVKRLRPFARLNLLELEHSRIGSDRDKTKKEEAARLKTVLSKKSEARLIYLEEKGQLFDSLEFAAELNKDLREQVFVIGGALGLDRTDLPPGETWSLSALTFDHELARVVLYEQLYRAAAIGQGKTYHY